MLWPEKKYHFLCVARSRSEEEIEMQSLGKLRQVAESRCVEKGVDHMIANRKSRMFSMIFVYCHDSFFYF